MSALLLVGIEFLTLLTLLVSMSLLVGRLGIWSVGHVAFFAIGQLILGFSIATLHLPLYAAVLLAVTIGAAIASLVGVASLRLEQDFFVVLSIGLSWAIEAVAYATYGARGVAVETQLRLPAILQVALLLGLPLLLLLSIQIWISRTHWSVTLAAIKQEPVLAGSLGIATLPLRIALFALSGAFAAFVGAGHGILARGTDPGLNDTSRGVLLFCVLVLGGVESLAGITAATLLYVAIPRIVEFFLVTAKASYYAGTVNQVAFAIATYSVLRARSFNRATLKQP